MKIAQASAAGVSMMFIVASCGDSSSPLIPGDDGGTDGGSGDETVYLEGSLPPDAADGPSMDGSVDGDAAMGVDAPHDAPVDMVVDSPTVCPPQTADDATGVFVLDTGSNMQNCGTKGQPCGSVDWALQVAASTTGKTTVYVGCGVPPCTFTETVTLRDAKALYGGWQVNGTTWTHDCNAAHVTIQAPASANVTLSATNLADTTIIDSVTIASKATALPGESLYGIFANTSVLSLDNVFVQIAAAGAGGGGSNGSPGGAGANACAAAGNGMPGATGTAGVAGPTGSFTSSGYTPVNSWSGSTGGTGVTGGNGQLGSINMDTGGDACGGLTNCVVTAMGTVSSIPGSPGCGGMGGTGGVAGTPGGSSFGLYAWAGSVTLTGGGLAAGNGGGGGAAGSGATGGGGGTGTAGAPSGTVTVHMGQQICTGQCVWTGCTLVSTMLGEFCEAVGMSVAPVGTNGTAGAIGGTGGSGGGAAGGYSYSYYAGGMAVVTANGTSFAFGTKGAGGAPNGTAGAAGAHN